MDADRIRALAADVERYQAIGDPEWRQEMLRAVGVELIAEGSKAWDADVREFLVQRSAVDQPSITCPVCGMTSYHPEDIRQGYCGRCHDYTSPSSDGSPELIGVFAMPTAQPSPEGRRIMQAISAAASRLRRPRPGA